MTDFKLNHLIEQKQEMIGCFWKKRNKEIKSKEQKKKGIVKP